MRHHFGIGLAVVAALAVGGFPTDARAGSYTINNCPSAGNGNAGSWTIFGSPQADNASCAGSNGWIGPQGGSMGPNTSAGVTIAAPPGSGITIQEARVWWWVPNSVSGATTFAVAGTDAGTIGAASTPLDRTTTPDDFMLPSTSTSLTLTDYCSSDDYSNGCTFGGGENPILQLHGAELTLADSNPPSGTITGGGLASGGTVSGNQSFAFTASDGGSGIRLVQLIVDGQVAATNDYLAQCPYENFAACPTTISDQIGWNSASVGNGPHEVALRITNAAQVSATVDDHEITTHNPPHLPNGAPACEKAQLGLSIDGKRQREAVIRYGRRVRISGRLVCGSAPVVGATITVTGGGLQASASTNQLGRFTYLVPNGPNRLITVGYRAYADDRHVAASGRERLSVMPRMRLGITPRQTVNGGTIIWHGSVRGGPYPAGGVTLLVEVREGTHWQPFDEIVAPRGVFEYRYTFLRTTRPTFYRFRVALPTNGAGGYRYTPAGSNSVTVRVR